MNTIEDANEQNLIDTPDCPKCLSSAVLFNQFRGELIGEDKTKPATGIKILAKEFTCKSCGLIFEITDGIWIGLELADWYQAMRHNLPFNDIVNYSNYIRSWRNEA